MGNGVHYPQRVERFAFDLKMALYEFRYPTDCHGMGIQTKNNDTSDGWLLFIEELAD